MCSVLVSSFICNLFGDPGGDDVVAGVNDVDLLVYEVYCGVEVFLHASVVRKMK